MSGQCRVDISVSCPFRVCIASSIEACNFKSGRFTRRFYVVLRPKRGEANF